MRRESAETMGGFRSGQQIRNRDESVWSRQWRHAVAETMALDAAIAPAKPFFGPWLRVPVDFERLVSHVQDPVVGDSGAGIEARLHRAIESHGSVRHLQDEERR